MSNPISYIGRIWSNGEFGIAREREYTPQKHTPSLPQNERDWNAAMLAVHGLWTCLKYAGLQQLLSDRVHSGNEQDLEGTRDNLTALDSSLLTNSHRTPRGSKGISRYGGKLVRNGAFIMERDYDKSRLTFLTMTLPNISQSESERLAGVWDQVVRVFCQRLKRHLRSRRLPGEIVGVTEVQEKRAALTGVFGLHLHMVFVGRKRSHGWVVTPADVKKFWQSALEKYLDNPLKHYDWRAVENIQRVKKSASGYLGKYLSKGLKSVQKLKAMFPNIRFPSSWYICTNTLRKSVKHEQVRVSGELGRVLADICESGCKDLLGYVKRVDINLSDGMTIPIGWTGRMTQEGRLMFFEFKQTFNNDW